MKCKYIPVIVAVVAIFSIMPHWEATSSIPREDFLGSGGDGEITLFNTHTDELLRIMYKNKEGEYLEKGLKDAQFILRCRLTNEESEISPKLLELVDHIEDQFGGKKVEIISGYRSPELNGTLRSKGRGVASRSLHLKGMAADIRIPGVPTSNIRDFARALRAGGVGYYPGPDFVHVDVGRVRYW